MKFTSEFMFDKLTKCDFNDDEIRRISKSIVDVGIIPDRTCKYGQPPRIDGIKSYGRIGRDELERLKPIFESPFLKGLELFPKGIIDPTIFEFVADFGNPNQQF